MYIELKNNYALKNDGSTSVILGQLVTTQKGKTKGETTFKALAYFTTLKGALRSYIERSTLASEDVKSIEGYIKRYQEISSDIQKKLNVAL